MKYQNFLRHKASQYFLFRDLVQNALKEGRLKFAEKSKTPMKIVSGPLQIEETHYVELVKINMVRVTKNFDMEAEEEADKSNKNNVNVFYPKVIDDLVNFLHRFKEKESKVMLYPKCSYVFKKKVAKEVENA